MSASFEAFSILSLSLQDICLPCDDSARDVRAYYNVTSCNAACYMGGLDIPKVPYINVYYKVRDMYGQESHMHEASSSGTTRMCSTE